MRYTAPFCCATRTHWCRCYKAPKRLDHDPHGNRRSCNSNGTPKELGKRHNPVLPLLSMSIGDNPPVASTLTRRENWNNRPQQCRSRMSNGICSSRNRLKIQFLVCNRPANEKGNAHNQLVGRLVYQSRYKIYRLLLFWRRCIAPSNTVGIRWTPRFRYICPNRNLDKKIDRRDSWNTLVGTRDMIWRRLYFHDTSLLGIWYTVFRLHLLCMFDTQHFLWLTFSQHHSPNNFFAANHLQMCLHHKEHTRLTTFHFDICLAHSPNSCPSSSFLRIDQVDKMNMTFVQLGLCNILAGNQGKIELLYFYMNPSHNRHTKLLLQKMFLALMGRQSKHFVPFHL